MKLLSQLLDNLSLVLDFSLRVVVFCVFFEHCLFSSQLLFIDILLLLTFGLELLLQLSSLFGKLLLLLVKGVTSRYKLALHLLNDLLHVLHLSCLLLLLLCDRHLIFLFNDFNVLTFGGQLLEELFDRFFLEGVSLLRRWARPILQVGEGLVGKCSLQVTC